MAKVILNGRHTKREGKKSWGPGYSSCEVVERRAKTSVLRLPDGNLIVKRNKDIKDEQ